MLLLVLLIEIAAFLVIDFLFSRKEAASKLTDARISQKTLRAIYTFQLLFIILGVVFIIDVWSIMSILT